MLTWQQKLTVATGASALCFATYLMILSNAASKAVDYTLLQIKGDSASLGYFDPSLEYAPQAGDMLMAYTGLESPDRKMSDVAPKDRIKMAAKIPQEPMASVNIALKQKGSADWTYKTTAFKTRIDDLMTEDGSSIWARGFWRYEQPSIIYDPKDTGREWKLFAYKYFWSGDTKIARKTGSIVFKSTTDPLGEWGREDWLFSSSAGQPPKPYQSLILLHLNTLHPSLSAMTGYSDPGAYAGGGAIFLSLAGFENQDYTEYIHFFVSLDHGQSWQFINTPFTPEITAKMGYSRVGAPAIFTFQKRKFLSVSMGDNKTQYKGAFIFEFDDLAKGTLKKDATTGLPLIIAKIPLITAEEQMTGTGGGMADFDENLPVTDGVIFSEVPGYKSMSGFRLFASKKNPLGK